MAANSAGNSPTPFELLACRLYNEIHHQLDDVRNRNMTTENVDCECMSAILSRMIVNHLGDQTYMLCTNEFKINDTDVYPGQYRLESMGKTEQYLFVRVICTVEDRLMVICSNKRMYTINDVFLRGFKWYRMG